MVKMNEVAFKKAYDEFAGRKTKLPTKEKLFFAIRTYLEHAHKHTVTQEQMDAWTDKSNPPINECNYYSTQHSTTAHNECNVIAGCTNPAHRTQNTLPKTLEQERDEHVFWTRQHYGNESANKIKSIYDENIAIQSNQNRTECLVAGSGHDMEQVT